MLYGARFDTVLQILVWEEFLPVPSFSKVSSIKLCLVILGPAIVYKSYWWINLVQVDNKPLCSTAGGRMGMYFQIKRGHGESHFIGFGCERFRKLHIRCRQGVGHCCLSPVFIDPLRL